QPCCFLPKSSATSGVALLCCWKKVLDRAGEAGQHVRPVELFGLSVDPNMIARAVLGHDSAPEVGRPHEPDARLKPVRNLLSDLARCVARRQHFYHEVGRHHGEVPWYRARWKAPGCDKGGVW